MSRTEQSSEFSDDGMGDSFEESKGNNNGKKLQTYENKPYDAGVELSNDFSVADSYDQNDTKKFGITGNKGGNTLKNQKYDEAFEVSQSVDKVQDGYPPKKNSTAVVNKPFDEAMDFSDDESKFGGESKNPRKSASEPPANKNKSKPPSDAKRSSFGEDSSEADHEEEDENEASTSYENIEGAYNPAQYDNLNVSSEVKDLFQYINRFKPHEVDLMTTLKCFIPEYIPSIGEIDAFIKIPRPDGRSDELGLKFLDEPAANQSDPTVLELQLRSLTKKVQSSDVVVRSVEDAAKNNTAIDRWIQSISDLHGSKPPPQVVYKNNYPDIETLMQQWPDGFEEALQKIQLPSPDLDLSLPEYAKVLCSILDIPTYDNNPIEPLHLMFSLYLDFKNNPHFMSPGEGMDAGAMDPNMNAYGGADVMEIEQGAHESSPQRSRK